MYLCKTAWQSLASRLARSAALCCGHVPFRQMSSQSVPGSSGENLIYYLVFFGASGAGITYAYKTFTSDRTRYNERINYMQEKNTAEWKPKPWPPQESEETDAKEVTEASDDEKDAEREVAGTVATDESQVQNNTHTESNEVQNEEESPVEEASSGVQEEQDTAFSSGTVKSQDNVTSSIG
ncbi:protein MGARP isoform X2 [Varanus komodoensis]|uniref:protein MGARP isoform X2 n=1 Tax=Varanus komodoensis TaxID=61221 RepID=UPI001CF78C95|nr:protein MGARP isoform X2 [Varanus komodoensis]